MSSVDDDQTRTAALLKPWPGPYGGLPPFDQVTPAALEQAYRAAVDLKRAEVQSIATNPAPPTFDNTLAALEDCGRALKRVQCLLGVYEASMATGDVPAVAQRLAPLRPALEDEINHNEAHFARIDAVLRARSLPTLTAEQRRLVEVVHQRMKRRGAGLPAANKARLSAINGRLAALSSQYGQSLIAEQDQQAVFIDDEAGLAGLPPALRQSAAAAATAKGRPGCWAVPNQRPAVWPFLTHSNRRDLREQVWRMWTQRGDNAGPHDNKPIAAEILQLRGEKARLLGYPSYAHLAMADRMARTPEAALAMMQRTWAAVLATTRAQIAQFQAIADVDTEAEGAGFTLKPWDRLHYAEKLRRERFGLDGDAVKPYLALESVLQAMFWSAGQLHGLAFKRLTDVPLVHPSCRVYEVSRSGEAMGVLYLDLFHRAGKMHGSYQSEYRAAENFRGPVLPISCIVSGLPVPAEGEPALLPWEYANVFFHEFGHALHMLCGTASYPTLGSMGVAWDLVELPALLNERWLRDGALLQRFARHHITGEPMPLALVQSIERAEQFDRIFSVNLDYLGGAIVDLKMHLLADGTQGKKIDVVALENQVLADLALPDAWDQIMRVTHNFHCFVGAYSAGLYSYLWADVMAADVAEAFAQAPGGNFDAGTAQRWRETILSVGNTVPADQAFRNFRGRDPDPDALLRRFGLNAPVTA